MTIFHWIGYTLAGIAVFFVLGLLSGDFWTLLFIVPLMVIGVVWQVRWDKSHRR